MPTFNAAALAVAPSPPPPPSSPAISSYYITCSAAAYVHRTLLRTLMTTGKYASVALAGRPGSAGQILLHITHLRHAKDLLCERARPRLRYYSNVLGLGVTSSKAALAVEASQVAGEETPTSLEGAANTFISVLAVAAFIALILFSFGVIYLSVADFMAKPSSDSEDKTKESEVSEDPVRLRPKGFGKKIKKGN